MKHAWKTTICAALIGISTLGAALPAKAETCGGNSLAAELMKKHKDKLAKLGCKGDKECATHREDLVKNLISVWNQLADNSPATIGPRRLDLGVNLQGTVLNPGERRFISLPILDHDKVKLTLKKEGGQSETDIVISKLDPDGKCSEVAHKTVPFGTGSYKKTFTVDSARGSILIVHLVPKSVLRKLEYTLRADGQ